MGAKMATGVKSGASEPKDLGKEFIHSWKTACNFDFADHITIVILGASGDLARKKIYPSFWALYRDGYLPPTVNIVGYARTKGSFDTILAKMKDNLKVKHGDQQTFERFCKANSYVAGAYDNDDDLQKLNAAIKKLEHHGSSHGPAVSSNRLFYLALPPSVYKSVTTGVRKNLWHGKGWHRIIIEKPFGKDSKSSDDLSQHLTALFKEKEIFRIDHYLGKEMVQNVIALRFSNIAISRMWDRRSVANVLITMKEPFGTEGRGGYFDEFGIIRDVIQNHLLQVCAAQIARRC